MRRRAARADPREPIQRAVGRLVVLRFAGTELPAYARRALREGRAGGVILFGDNLAGPAQLRRLTRDIRAASGGRALVLADQEGGDVRIVRWAGPERAAAAQAAAGAARADARAAARRLRAAGVTVALAPVADVPTVPGSALASRAFADEPGAAARAVAAAVRGWREGGVAPTVKHFPGLGGATVNTDDGPADVAGTPDLGPFRAGIEAGAPLVMVGHARYPALDPRRIASQSEAIVEGRLRRELGFRGVAITDSLEAAAVARRAPVDLAAERSVRAGVDLALTTGAGSAIRVYRRLLATARRSEEVPRARARELRARAAAAAGVRRRAALATRRHDRPTGVRHNRGVSDLPRGAEFAGCRIETLAGKGGMGVVYRATQLSLGRPVAVKLIADDRAADAAFRERFERESRMAAAIDHPNVIPVHAAGEEDGRLYLVMRYVHGTDLHALLAKEGRLEPYARRGDRRAGRRRARRRPRRRARPPRRQARQRAHRRAARRRARLPLGLRPHPLRGPGHAAHHHRRVDRHGRLHVARAPARRPDRRALGRLRARLRAVRRAHRHAPFPRKTVPATMLAHLHDTPPRPSDTPGVPAAFDRVLARALAKDPADRYPSAGDLGRAAQAAARGEHVTESERSVARGPAAPPAGDEAAAGGAVNGSGNGHGVTEATVRKPTTTRRRGLPRPGRPAQDDGRPAFVKVKRARRRPRRIAVAAVGGAALTALAIALATSLAGGGTSARTGPVSAGEVRDVVDDFATAYEHEDAKALTRRSRATSPASVSPPPIVSAAARRSPTSTAASSPPTPSRAIACPTSRSAAAPSAAPRAASRSSAPAPARSAAGSCSASSATAAAHASASSPRGRTPRPPTARHAAAGARDRRG